MLYSKGGIGQAIAEDWETVLNNFVLSLKTIRTFAPTPADVNGLSKKQKKTFIKLFRDLDHDYAHLKSFSTFEPKILDEYGFSQQIYEDSANCITVCQSNGIFLIEDLFLVGRKPVWFL